MHQFTITPEGLKDLGKKIIIRLAILFAFIFLLLTVIQFPTYQKGQDLGNLPYIVVMLFAVMGFSAFNAVRRQKRLLGSYKLIITEDSITREMLNTPSITIAKSEVKEITGSINGALTIVADSKLNAIGVPAQLNNIEQLRQIAE